MSISRFTPEQINKLSSGDRYYLRFRENEMGEGVWSIVQLDYVQWLFRFLGCWFEDTRLDFIGEKLKNEKDPVPERIKELVDDCWRRTFQGDLGLKKVEVEAVTAAAPPPKLGRANHLESMPLVRAVNDVQEEWEAIPPELLVEEKSTSSSFEEFKEVLKNPALNRLTRNVLSTEFVVGGSAISLEGGELARKRVDAIVHPSNDLFDDHKKMSDISKSIYDLAGEELNDLCRTLPLLPSGKRVDNANPVVTTSGDLAHVGTINHIVHTTVASSERTLSENIRATLEKAKNEGISSIAFPLIDMENGSLVMEKTMKSSLDTVRTFLIRNPGSIQEVKFIFRDDNEDAAMEFMLATTEAKSVAKNW